MNARTWSAYGDDLMTADKRADVNRLGQVAVKAGRQEALAIVFMANAVSATR